MAGCIEEYLRLEQAIVRLACTVQQDLNKLLGRLPPQRPFDASQMDIHNLLQAAEVRRLPYLEDELEEALGIRIRINQDRIEVAGPGKEMPAYASSFS
jgi:hypothetical protein